MNHRILNYFSFILVVTVLVSGFLYKIPSLQATTVLENAQADKIRLEAELSALEKEIAIKQKALVGQKGESSSISRDISTLSKQITKARFNIRAKDTIIQKLGGEINQKNTQIKQLISKIENEKASLAQLIRKERQIDDKSIIILLLSGNTISETYQDINAFAILKNDIRISVEKIKNTKNDTEIIRKGLENKKNAVINTKYKLETKKKKVEISEYQKKKDLSISKNKELKIKKILTEKAKRRAEILSALFKLRDASAIPFSEALKYANFASKRTGVRPAFLLAILTQESNLGANQGSCYLTNTLTGAGIIIKNNKPIKRVMKPSRDVGPFIQITRALGLNPYKTLVSCPFSYGYGGAMGPSQFIPSTWNMIKNRVANILGIKTPDPWNPKDAFIASSLYLKDLGASNNSYKAERNAACRYYSGRSCSAPRVRNAFYGNSVMAKAKIIQNNINILQN